MTEHTSGKPDPKPVTAYFNGRPREVAKAEIYYDDIVRYAFENPPSGANVQFSIQYTKGHGEKPAGSVLEGGSVKVKDGMEFDVTPTNRS